MSLIRTFERRHDPAPVTGQVLLDIFGKNLKTAAGVNVTEKNALAMTAVWRAVAMISGTVAGLPLKTYRDGTTTETSVRVVNKPNPTQTGFELRERQTAHLALWGNSYSLKIRDGSNRIVELWPLIPDYVKPKLSNDRKVFEITPPNGDPIRTDASEILHIPGFGYDSVAGLSPIAMARETIAGGIAAEKFSAGIYKSGAMAGGLITTPRRLSSDQAKNIKTRWKDQVGGVENAYEIGVLDQGMKFERLTMPPTDIQFIDTRRFSVIEVARLYGVPPHMLMDVERSTSWGTGIEEQTIGFVVFTLQPGYLIRMESRYTREVVPSDQYSEFKVDGLLRGSSKVRADVYTKALDPITGWMDRSEVRALENLPPEPEDPEAEPVEDPGTPELDEELSLTVPVRLPPKREVQPAMSRQKYLEWKRNLHERPYVRGRQ